MFKNPKVLIAIPYHRAKRYCIDSLLDAIDEIDYPNKEILMRWDVEGYGGKDNVKKQREFFRNYALENGYDYLYFMGADTIPDKTAISRLVQTAENSNLSIIGGVYWGRHNAENGNPEGAVAWIHEMEQAEQTKLFSQEGTIVEVDGMGMDCVLIHRDVLEKISFMSWEQNDDDYPFYDKAKELGHKVYIDTSVQAKHYFKNGSFTHLAKVVINN